MNKTFRLFGFTITISNEDSPKPVHILERKAANEVGIWITAEGERIPVYKMTSDHLLHVYQYLMRWASRVSPTGNVRQVVKCHPFYRHLVKEMKERNLL